MLKKRLNGQLLAQNVGNQMILLGSINKVSSSGTSLELKTSDNMLVTVSLNDPIDSHLEGHVEVHGTVQTKSTVSCTSLITFPDELTQKFDVEQYNELIVLANTLGDSIWKMSETNTIL